MFTVGQTVTYRGNSAVIVEVLTNAVVIRFANGAQFTVYNDEVKA